MFKHYIKSAVRNFSKRKILTLINIVGLSTGMAAFILLVLYFFYETGYDKFYANKDSIYRIAYYNYDQGELAESLAKVYPAAGPALKKTFPEILDYARLYDPSVYGGCMVSYNDNRFYETKLYYADASFLKIFSLDLKSSGSTAPLADLNTVVISESTSKRYFGAENPVDKVLTLNDEYGKHDYVVAGVFKDVPLNSHITFDFLFSFPSLAQMTQGAAENSWGWTDFYTYIQLSPKANYSELEGRLPGFVDLYKPDLKNYNKKEVLKLQPLTDIHLYSQLTNEAEVNGNATVTYLLLVVAFLTLIMAWVNYINISTAISTERSKEVGVKKAIGAVQPLLIKQFLFESSLLNAVSLLVGIGLAALLYPFFTRTIGIDLPITFFNEPILWLFFIAIFFFGTFLSSFYPAFALSSVKPIGALRGNLFKSASRSKIDMGKALLVFQFASCIALTTGALVLYSQIDFMRNRNLGFSVSQVVVVKKPMIDNDFVAADSVLRTSKIEVFKNKLLEFPRVKVVSASSHIPGDEITGDNIRRQGSSMKDSYSIKILSVDDDFLKTLEIKMVEGRGFTNSYSAEQSNVILNAAAVRLLGYESSAQAVGQRVSLLSGDKEVIGVINNFDYNATSISSDVPIVIQFNPGLSSYYLVRIESSDLSTTIDGIKETYESVFFGNPFDFFFLDGFFNEQYKSDQRLANVLTSFSLLAIIIACIGVLGLVSFAVIKRTKEVGVRKILGATSASIVLIFIKDFLYMIIVSVFIALPFSYFAIDRWLEHYNNHVTLNAFFFIVPGIVLTLVVLITIGYHTVSVSRRNPVDSLRTE